MTDRPRAPGAFVSRSRARIAGWRVRRLEARGRAPIVYGNQVDVLAGGRACFAALEEAVANARAGIAIEMYTWADDRIGRRLADLVAERARAGVPVLVLLDSFGSLGSGALAARMAHAGARVLWYHALVPWVRRWSLNRRNHRKLVVVDGDIAFTGGINIAEAYTDEFAGDDAWRDLAVRVRGPAVREMARLFVSSWIGAGGEVADTSAVMASPRDEGTAGVQVFGKGGLRGRRRLRAAHLALATLARERIFVANAYFAPERPLIRVLCLAARRGVRVDLFLPGRSDAALVRWAGRAAYDDLLAAGVHIREMHHGVLHAKVAVFDGGALLTGSANLDYRSFRHNLEVAVTIIDPTAATDAEAALQADWSRSQPVDPATWARRSLVSRVMEQLATLVRYWL